MPRRVSWVLMDFVGRGPGNETWPIVCVCVYKDSTFVDVIRRVGLKCKWKGNDRPFSQPGLIRLCL